MQENERLFEDLWGDLARYNAEIHRGVQHTPERQAEMATKQAAYDRGEWRRKRP